VPLEEDIGDMESLSYGRAVVQVKVMENGTRRAVALLLIALTGAVLIIGGLLGRSVETTLALAAPLSALTGVAVTHLFRTS
jgi:hypothetical protein